MKSIVYVSSSIHSALLHFGEPPNVFVNLKVSTLIALFKDEPSAPTTFALIFERTCRDINDINAKVLDELFELLKQFKTNELSQQKILLEIGVLVVVNLFRDFKNRAHCDQFRDILFDTIKDVAKNKDDVDWLFGTTLPAFSIIMKAYIANKSDAKLGVSDDDETIQLIKLFLTNSVIYLASAQNNSGFCHYYNLRVYKSDTLEMWFHYGFHRRSTVRTSIRSGC